MPLPYGRQLIEDDDIAAVVDVLRGDWLTTGPNIAEFEAALAEEVGAEHVVCCSNGTTALHLAALAQDLGPGQAAIVPSITFAATANAALYVGADVQFADVDPETGLMTADSLEDAIAAAGDIKPTIVLPVHLNGQCVDMDAIAATARANDMRIVEDASHALGSSYRTKKGDYARAGECRHGDAAVFSFHPVKTIAVGEGGAVTTNDAAAATNMRRLRNHGMSKDSTRFANHDLAFATDGQANPWYYEVGELGFNYRLTDISCALGLSQLAKLDRFVARRREIVAQYNNGLGDLSPRLKPVRHQDDAHTGWHLYPVLIDFEALSIDRAEFIRRLSEQGVGTQVHYVPLHRQPLYRRFTENRPPLPGADEYYSKVLSIPLFPSMTDDDASCVIGALHDVMASC